MIPGSMQTVSPCKHFGTCTGGNPQPTYLLYTNHQNICGGPNLPTHQTQNTNAGSIDWFKWVQHLYIQHMMYVMQIDRHKVKSPNMQDNKSNHPIPTTLIIIILTNNNRPMLHSNISEDARLQFAYLSCLVLDTTGAHNQTTPCSVGQWLSPV